MTIQTTVTHTEKRDVEITVPSFWKEPTTAYKHYRALLDTDTYCEIYVFDDSTTVKNATPDAFMVNGEISEAHQKWDLCDEEDFLVELSKALKSMKMEPVLTTNSFSHERHIN
jgi:hypothetical protein